MSGNFPVQSQRYDRFWPWLAIVALATAMIVQLRLQDRLWWCACGQMFLWSGEVLSQHNSQHLADPYTFTHVLHGFLFWWLVAWVCPRLATAWQLFLALLIEAGWEVIENTEFVIRRYREETASLGYEGDTIANSCGDLAATAIGFFIARYLGWRITLVLFFAIELLLLAWIRDSLFFSTLMLLVPIEAIKQWQLAG